MTADNVHPLPARRLDGSAPLNDLSNARLFAAQHGHTVRHAPQLGRWYVWDGRVWGHDETGIVDRLAKEVVDAFDGAWRGATDQTVQRRIFKHWQRSGEAPRIRAQLELARTEPGIPVLAENLDADPYALAVANGVIDLRTGELSPHDQDQLVTRIVDTNYRADAIAPRWLQFLNRVFEGDDELIAWLQRALGYSATGDTSEHTLCICWGSGANGKSTLLDTIGTLLAGHAWTAPEGLLVAQQHEQHPTRLASLYRRRFVTSYELENRRRLNESLVKQLTGGDPITARYMRQDYFQFVATHKLWLATNHKPKIVGDDHAIWRRIQLIPFTVAIPKAEQVPDLAEELLATEAEGILAWLVAGAMDWHQDRLGACRAVTDATETYRTEEDVLSQFIEECCVLTDLASVGGGDLLRTWRGWCKANRVSPGRDQDLTEKLEHRGFDSTTARTRTWLGIGLLADRKEP